MLGSALVRLFAIGGLVALFIGSIFLMPSADYLPTGNRNLFFTFIRMPPGLTLDETDRLMSQIEQRFLHHPAQDRMFAVARRGAPIIGFVAKREVSDYENMQRIHGELQGAAMGVPDCMAFVSQSSLFQRGFSGGKVITVDITGPELDDLIRISEEVNRAVQGIDGVIRTDSSFQAGNPELQVEIDSQLAADLGLTVSDVADVVETAVGGTDISLYREGGDEYDIVLECNSSALVNPDTLRALEVSTRDGRMLPLSTVARVVETSGPTQIQHIEMDRSITLTVNLAESAPLQQVIDRIETEIAEPLRSRLPPTYQISFSGSADDLARTFEALKWTLIFALVITYLLLTALFQSFLYPIVIMITLPLAATGGFLGLSVTHWLYSLGVLAAPVDFNVVTMFGFVILVGIVVNNAILIVSQTLQHMRDEGHDARTAIEEACMNRLRPIFMSTLSSVLGMLPLALGGGNGSELYSGLGIVVVGGLTLSTLFTLILVPSVFIIFIRIQEMLVGRTEPVAVNVAG
jgi:HAE1 family hydrophobic/amphiphilic exporter-1